MNTIKAIGIMSGSSLDGLDLAFCEFKYVDNSWQYSLLAFETVPFPVPLREQLSVCRNLAGYELQLLDLSLGEWIAEKVVAFINNHSLNPDLISSHGHTVFHNPGKKISVQIGNAQAIAIRTDLPVITNFRQPDVLKGGQGAPLAPVGDIHLFAEYDACINLGGIANISISGADKTLAWDIGPCNQVLDALSHRLGFSFDKDGQIARAGKINEGLVRKWEEFSYFKASPPKSMSNEWVAENFLNRLPDSPTEGLRSFIDFLSKQVSKDIQNYAEKPLKKILLTGGGAKNSFLVETLKNEVSIELVVPSAEIIDFKEAIIFSFLGVLRYQNKTNILASVTGATSDSVAGTIYLP